MALGGVGLILRSLGVNVTPEQVAQLEQFIPQIIPRAVQIINVLNERITFYNEQFAKAEAQRVQLATDVQELKDKLEALHESIRNSEHKLEPAGTATGGNGAGKRHRNSTAGTGSDGGRGRTTPSVTVQD
jgi:hypothetical protein